MWVESEFFSLAKSSGKRILKKKKYINLLTIFFVNGYDIKYFLGQQRPHPNPGDATARIELQLTLFDIPA